jgi:hypothetical protein
MLQLNMGVRLSVHNAQLLLIQDAKSARSNAAALVVSAAIHVHSGSREEALAVDLGNCALLPVIYGRGGLTLLSQEPSAVRYSPSVLCTCDCM